MYDNEPDDFVPLEELTLDNARSFSYCSICQSITGMDYTTHLLIHHPNTFLVMSSLFLNDPVELQTFYQNAISTAVDNVIDYMDYASLQQLCDTIGYHKEGIGAIEKVVKEVERESVEGELCPICMEELGGEDKQQPVVETVACHHLFCRGCIGTWLKENKCCPVCKKELQIASMSIESSEPKQETGSAPNSVPDPEDSPLGSSVFANTT